MMNTDIPVYCPLVTLDKYAELVGLSVHTVRAQHERGYIPSVKVGKRVMVNLEAIRLSAQRQSEGFQP